MVPTDDAARLKRMNDYMLYCDLLDKANTWPSDLDMECMVVSWLLFEFKEFS